MERVARLRWWRVPAAIGLAVLCGCSDGNADDFIWGRTPVFTPDGARVIYGQNLSTPSDQVTNTVSALDVGVIWGIDISGQNTRKITPEGRGPDFFPAVSPNGTQIAFASGENNQFDIFVMNIDGSGRRRLTFDLAADTNPCWRPDGLRLVFVSDRSGNNDLWSINLDGTGLTQLTSFPSDEASPSYSPDGSRIAFASNMDRSNFDLWTMAADGGDLRQLTRKDNAGSSLADGQPDWSPDGARLVFERWNENWDIFQVDADGQNLTRLTVSGDHDGDPVYSPDGATIAFTTARSGWWQVWLMNADGTNQRQLTGTGS